MRRDRSSDQENPDTGSRMSVALLAGVAFMPIVIAVGFMMEPSDRAGIPADVSVAAMRGGLDSAPDHHGSPPARAGY